ncbi:MAG: hypothetical protein H7258_08145 [Ferruginibacter sp.]|nr:hypothetical protein [Ferruginibacter sp.]
MKISCSPSGIGVLKPFDKLRVTIRKAITDWQKFTGREAEKKPAPVENRKSKTIISTST